VGLREKLCYFLEVGVCPVLYFARRSLPIGCKIFYIKRALVLDMGTLDLICYVGLRFVRIACLGFFSFPECVSLLLLLFFHFISILILHAFFPLSRKRYRWDCVSTTSIITAGAARPRVVGGRDGEKGMGDEGAVGLYDTIMSIMISHVGRDMDLCFFFLFWLSF